MDMNRNVYLKLDTTEGMIQKHGYNLLNTSCNKVENSTQEMFDVDFVKLKHKMSFLVMKNLTLV